MHPALRSLLAATLAAVTLSCGPRLRRDLASVPQRQITYDDLCGLQAHFDQRRAARAAPYRALSEQSNETSETQPDEFGRMRRVMQGEGTYLVRDRSDRRRLAQLLREEYTRLPALRLTRPETEVTLTLSWWQSGSIRRARPDLDVVLSVDGTQHTLPPSPCLGEFLFGDEAYAMRRNVVAAEQDRSQGRIPRAYIPADAGDGSDAGEVPPGDADLR